MGTTPKGSSFSSSKQWAMRLWIWLSGSKSKRGPVRQQVAVAGILCLALLLLAAATGMVHGPLAASLAAVLKQPLRTGTGKAQPGAPFLAGPRSSIQPHGPSGPDGSPPRLVQLMVGPSRQAEILSDLSSGLIGSTWTLTPRQTCDTELLLNGGFSPLVGFMDRYAYKGVVEEMRLGPGLGLGVAADDETARALLTMPDDGTYTDAVGLGPFTAPGAAGQTLPSKGSLWPMPITLDMPREALTGVTTVDGRTLEEMLASVGPGQGAATKGHVLGKEGPVSTRGPYGLPVLASSRLLLRDAYANAIAVLTVTDMWIADRGAECASTFGTMDESHPGVAHLMTGTHEVYVGGILEGLALPQHFDFTTLRRTPTQVRAELASRGWARTVAFQTRNPMHRAHIELTRLAGEQVAAGVLLHPVVGMTKPGDVEYAVRVRCYEAVAGSGRYYPPGGVLLSLLPLAMRMAGPREALWHAIIRKNYGATHFIVGRDHAGVKSGRTGKDIYGPYAAQQLVLAHASELGMQVIPFQEVEYVPRLGLYLPSDRITPGEKTLSISGTKFRAMMARGQDIPSWFSDPDVIRILRALQPPTRERGFVVFFSGLSGGGKTTLSHALIQRLQALVPTRKISILDGDVVRTHLSKGLGFSIADRNANIERIGFVAAEAARHGGIVIAAPIAPFEASRREVRRLVSEAGAGFVLVHVGASVGECASRDVKGLYGAAGYGRVMEAGAGGKGAAWRFDLSSVSNDLTGISHPYEHPPPLTEEDLMPGLAAAMQSISDRALESTAKPARDGPSDPGSLAGVDVWVDTETTTVADGAGAIIARLIHLGYIEDEDGGQGQERKDDDGTGRRASRLTDGEAAMVGALHGIAPGDDGLAIGCAPACGKWVHSIVQHREALAAVFPTAIAEGVSKAALARYLFPSVPRAVPGVDTSYSPVSPQHLPPSSCRADWDHFLVPARAQDGRALTAKEVGARKDKAGIAEAHGSGPAFLVDPASDHVLVRAHAGLPSRGSPSAKQLQAAPAPTLAVGQQPPRLVMVFMLDDDALTQVHRVQAVSAALTSSVGYTSVLPSGRVRTSLEWAAAAEGGAKGKGTDSEMVHPLLMTPDAWSVLEENGHGGLVSLMPALPVSARVAAAHDLWTGVRWTAAAELARRGGGGEPSGVHAVPATACVIVPPAASRAMLHLLHVLLRLDPCLQAIIVGTGCPVRDMDGESADFPGGRVVFLSGSALDKESETA